MKKANRSPIAESIAVPAWAPWPLRLFLGGSFIWASLDKLLDPEFLNAAAPGYVGHQLAAGVAASPIGALTTTLVVPNAQLFGALVMAGELLIGLAVLLGWYTRFSAALGLLINAMFYLTITWDVQPFYFGADLPYAAGWLTLLLIGPGALSVDALLRQAAAPGPVVSGALKPATSAISRRRFNALVGGGIAAVVIGGLDVVGWPLLHGGNSAVVASGTPLPTPSSGATAAPSAVAIADTATTGTGDSATTVATADSPTAATAVDPPTLRAADSPTVDPTAATDVPYSTPGLSADTQATLTAQPTTAPTDVPAAPTDVPTAAPVAPTDTPIALVPTDTPVAAAPTKTAVAPTKAPTAVPTAVTGKKRLVAPDQIAVNESLPFTVGGSPAVLVRLPSGYVAYSAVCTHEGCTVAYKGATQHLVCPCHSAQFDPAAQGAAVRGPARRPLSAIAITVAPDGSVYLA